MKDILGNYTCVDVAVGQELEHFPERGLFFCLFYLQIPPSGAMVVFLLEKPQYCWVSFKLLQNRKEGTEWGRQKEEGRKQKGGLFLVWKLKWTVLIEQGTGVSCTHG